MAKKPQLTLVHGFAPPEDVETLAHDKLVASGLTIAEGRRLGLTWHDAVETRTLDQAFWALPCLRIPYLEPVSRLPMRAAPNWPPFYRVRALRTPDPLPDDFSKYLQPPESGVCAYFPSVIDWAPLLDDHTRPLTITEGELKAAKACIEGIPTIGLGGVYSYRSILGMGLEFLPSLERIVWARRTVYLIFDSDLQSNSQVCKAMNGLAEALARRGAIPKLVLLPAGEDDAKVGLDDFLVANHPDVLRAMMKNDAIHLGLSMPLWTLNERYAYIPMLDRAVRRNDVWLASPAHLRNAETADYLAQVLRDDGTLSTARVSAVDKWLSWPLRQEARRLTYAPGLAPLDLVPSDAPGATVEDADYNTWTGWAVEPREGDCTPFLELVDHLFTGATPGAKEWFLRWCAYPLRYPGTKLFSSCVIYGLAQGTGKSQLGYTLGRIYGRNFTEIKEDDIHGNFNEWAIGKQLIMGDDVTGSDKQRDLDMLKKMITQRELRINAKNQPTYVLPDKINYLWTSNRPDAFFLEDKDRRFFIHEVTANPLPDAFYARYRDWLAHDDGPAALFYHLTHLDLGDFNPYGRAFDTDAKVGMTRNTRSDLGNWVRDLIAFPDELLRMGDTRLVGDLFTNTELRHLYAHQAGLDPAGVAAKRVAAELARAGVRQVHRGRPVSVEGRALDRYYAVRHAAKWADQDLAALQAHLRAPATPPARPAARAKKY